MCTGYFPLQPKAAMAMCVHFSGLVFSLNKSFALEQNLGNHCDVLSYGDPNLWFSELLIKNT